jgi:hypothetical protein
VVGENVGIRLKHFDSNYCESFSQRLCIGLTIAVNRESIGFVSALWLAINVMHVHERHRLVFVHKYCKILRLFQCDALRLLCLKLLISSRPDRL